MQSEAGIKKYIYDWLVGLNIGRVFQDRMPYDDTSKLSNNRSYIIYDFPDGIEDQGAWFFGVCRVCIGCRDKSRFVADLATLDKNCGVFHNEFDKNDNEAGISCIDLQYVDDYSDDIGNHEYQYLFDVYAQKG
jgi:hypothetical protein